MHCRPHHATNWLAAMQADMTYIMQACKAAHPRTGTAHMMRRGASFRYARPAMTCAAITRASRSGSICAPARRQRLPSDPKTLFIVARSSELCDLAFVCSLLSGKEGNLPVMTEVSRAVSAGGC